MERGYILAFVEFYQTSLSETDRCYDIDSYNTYLNANKNKYTLNITEVKDIIPNVSFYIDLSSQQNIIQEVMRCNYIVFTYNGIKYGSFIDSINPLAFAGKFRVVHHTDIWYMAQSLYKDTFDFHGQCIRAHVNEISSSTTSSVLSVNFRNTYNTPEETFSTKDFNMQQIPLTGFLRDTNYVWLYVYINNPNAIRFTDIGDRKIIQQQVLDAQPFQVRKYLNGLLLCGLLNLVNGLCYFEFNNDSSTGIPLSELTSEYITIMYTSRIPPTQTCEGTIVGGTTKPTISAGSYTTTGIENSTGLPSKVTIIWTVNLYDRVGSKTPIDELFKDFNTSTITLFQKSDYISASYEDYLSKYIFKQFTGSYNPAYIGNTFIDTTELADIDIALSPDGSYYWIVPQIIINNMPDIKTYASEYKYSQSICINNFNQFVPDTVLDYWTQINAKRSVLASEQQRFGSVMQGISGMLGMITSGMSGGLTAGAGAIKGDARMIASGASEVANSIPNMVSSVGNSIFGVAQANLSNEIANQQYRSGIGTKDIETGYYSSALSQNSPSILWYKQNQQSLHNIAIRLHRYGYNTFLQIDDIYKNHRRRHFNYIRCPNIEVHGVPTSVVNEISSMFQNGVHLWTCKEATDEVGNFEVNNHEMSVEV